MAKKPENLFVGTTSWIYEGWRNIVYFRPYRSKKEFKEKCLVEYFNNPLFDFVEIDHTYYSYPTRSAMDKINAQIPAGKKAILKITNTISRDGDDFLSSETFKREFLSAFSEDFLKKVLWFHLQFSRMQKPIKELIRSLSSFVEMVGVRISVEFRNPEYLTIFEKLQYHNIVPCLNHWTWMSSLQDQFSLLDRVKVPEIYVRLLTPQNVTYEDAVKQFYPYNHIKFRQEIARNALIQSLRAHKNTTFFVAVNNRFEGCAPLTIADILELLNAS